MQPLQTIESILTTLTDKDFKSIELLIKKQIDNNRQSFQTAIKEGDIAQIEKLLDKVSFDEEFLKTVRRNVVPNLSSLDYLSTKPMSENMFTTDPETLDTFYTLFNHVLDLGEERTFRDRVKKEKLAYNISDLLFAGLFYRLSVNFQYSGEEPFPQYLYLKKYLDKKPTVMKKIVDQFCQSSLHKINYQDKSVFIQELIKLGYKDTLFKQAKNLDNYSYMKNLIHVNNIYNDEFMLAGLSSYHFPMVKECFEAGVSFFRNDSNMTSGEKAQYKNVFSSVFSSKDSLEIQEFIIDNIPDISIGNHIIVKTIIHQLESSYETDIERNKTRLDFINKIFQRYNETNFETIKSLEQIISKREPSEAKTLLEKLIDYKNFAFKYPEKEIPVKENKNKI